MYDRPIKRFPSGDPAVSCELEPGDPAVPGVDADPGGVNPGIPAPGGHKWAAAGDHGKAPYGCGGYKP